jgi:hypothetical protein
MSVKNRLDKLLERLRRDEVNIDIDNEQEVRALFAKHGLRDEEDIYSRMHLGMILADLDQGILPNAGDIEVLGLAARYSDPPRKRGGSLRKNDETAQHDAEIKTEANALYKGRREQLHETETADESWQWVVREMKRLHSRDRALQVNPRKTRPREEWEMLRDRWYGR